jgi:predicted permease
VRPLQDVGADVAFALRSLGREPGFLATAVGVLALAIGAAAAVLTVVDSVLVAALPYPNAGRLVRVYLQNSPTNRWSLSVADYEAIREQQRSFSAFGLVRPGEAALTGAGEPESVRVGYVTSGFFTALGVKPAVGRLVLAADEPMGAPATVVVSDAFARGRWGSAAASSGHDLILDGKVHTVVGALPPGLEDLAGIRAGVWPVMQLPKPTRRGPFGLRGVGLLREGVALESASADLASISQRIFPLWASGFKDETARLAAYPLRDTVVGDAPRQIGLFGGAVALVLLVAVANVATLMLVRASAREHELGVRTALGASRGRLVRLVATEGLVLTTAAAAAGLAVAAIALRMVLEVAPGLPRAHEIVMNGRTALGALALGLVSGFAVSAAPVALALGARLGPSRSDVRRSGGDRRTHVARGLLVAAEFALAVPLLFAAALLATSFARLQEVDPGYDATSTLAVPLGAPARRYADASAVAAFWRRALDRALETPGVVAAGLATASPPDNQGDVNNFNLVAHPVPPGGAEPLAPWASATPGYFAALGIPLLEGRMFAETDTENAPPVAIVSRAWARRYFPGEDAIGQQMIEGGCYTCPRTTIVGIVGDVKYQGLAGGGEGVYVPLPQWGPREAALYVRTAGAPGSAIPPLLAALRSLDPELPLRAVTLSGELRRALRDPGRWAAVLAAFAGTALGLAGLGIFGLMSYVVRRQRREIGVRLALGAEPRRVARMIVARGMRHAGAGALVGLTLVFVQAPWLETLLYGVTPRDPGTLALVLALLAAAALLACLLPALRASRVGPAEVIRE